jgi:flagellar hook protein FlgE
VNVPDDTTAAARGTAEVQFGALSGNAVPEGTPGNLLNATGSVAVSSFAANTPATVSFTTNFGSGPQTIQLSLGDFGQSTGVTQYAGTAYSLSSLTQNGVPPGSYSGVTTNQNGDIVVNYDNGQSRTIAQAPLATFANPDALQRQNGQAFTAMTESGNPIVNAASTNGAGGLVASSVEASNVDIASEFSKLIVAQQAYTANSKVVTTANDLLTATIDMKR